MQTEQRVRYQIAELQKQWELVSQKLSQLERNRILETGTEERFRLDHRIAEVKAEREQLEQQLGEFERQIEQQQNLATVAEPAQDFRTFIPKVYHNLPQPDYGRFVGREAELTKVECILQPYPHSQHSVVTIDGIGGIGKSALALEIAHRYLRNYDILEPEKRFDAIIWTSAKQTVLTAEGISTRRQVLRTLGDIYNALAVALQREDVTRAGKEDQDEVVRNALTRQRTLLIVDNLETVDDEAVMDFLRELPAPTKAIVTTRHRLDVAYPARLTGMPWEDAQILIQQECEKKGVKFVPHTSTFASSPVKSSTIPNEDVCGTLDEDNARRLFDRTGGVPLAIVWSIAQMGFGYNVEAVLNRLGQPTSDISRFCFEGAVEQIHGKPAHKLLMVLSLCANDASRESLGYATGLPELDRDDGLVELEKLSLVNKKGDRFSLLPLTKQYALAELNKSPEKERLREQWIEYFRKLSEEYSALDYNWTNYDWLLAEGNNILSIVDWAIVNGFGETALLFTRAVQRYLNIIGSGRRLDYGEQLFTIAQSLHDELTSAWISVNWLAWHYVERRNTDRAETLIRRSLSIYQDLNDMKGICLAKNSLGDLLRLSDRYKDAEENFRQAMNLAREHGYNDTIASIHFQWGKLASELGDWEGSKIHWESVIEGYEKDQNEADQDILFLMGAFGHLGWVEFHLGNYHRARELTEKSLTVFERMGGKEHTAKLHRQLATIEKALGNYEKALQHAQEAYFWAERLGMVRELEGAQTLLKELNAENKPEGETR